MTTYRHEARPFGISMEGMGRHVYIIGQSGSGKSTLMASMMAAHAQRGDGFALLDFHQALARDVLNRIPASRAYQTVYFSPQDAYPVSLNPFVAGYEADLVVSRIISMFIRIWGETLIGPETQNILRNAIYAIAGMPGASLLWIPRLIRDKAFRQQVMSQTSSVMARAYWTKDFDLNPKGLQAQLSAPIKNKLDALLSFACMRHVLAQEKRTVAMEKIMNDGQIFIADIPKGLLGEENAQIMASMIVTEILLTALTRGTDQRPFYLYCDEAQNIRNILETILSEARKFKLSLIAAHQYRPQCDSSLLEAFAANAGTTIAFRLQPTDAEAMAAAFHTGRESPQAQDFINLPDYQAYIRLFVQGHTTSAFSMRTHPLTPSRQTGETIIRESRRRFGYPREKVEAKVEKFFGEPGR